MDNLTIVLLIFAFTIISYLLQKITLATTALISVILLVGFKAIDNQAVVSSFGNTTGILMVAMFVIAAGFNKTQLVKKMAANVSRIAKGSITKVMAGYVFLAVLLTQLIPSNLVPFCILYPLLGATLDEMKISRSKGMFGLGLIDIIAVGTLPIGGGATIFAELNGYLVASGSSYQMLITDPMKLRLPLLIIIALYCIFFAIKVSPDKPLTDIEEFELQNACVAAKPLKPFQEKAGYLIFIFVSVALLFSTQIGMQAWLIVLIGAILMVVTGVLDEKEAIKSMPIWVYFVFVGGLIMAGALSTSGAGKLVGDFIASIALQSRSTILLYTIFFMGPFILTQFILNRSAMMIFIPIVIQTCLSLGINPIGPIICVQAATLSAFMTPMATGTVPYLMGVGGYNQKSIIKQAIIPTIICIVVTIGWSSIAFPLF
ncbi:SLC13 family permease [Alkalibaculum sporogenes]|nr:SLC13 family permease [Alkalibaculum sporogenes]